MESANRHHQHQLQDQLVVSSPLLAANPSCYAPAPSNHGWTPNIILNTGSFNPNFNGILFNPRDSRQKNDSILHPLNSSVVQDLGFHWASNAGSFTSQSAHDLHPKIKEELSESFPKFTEMINSSSSAVEDLHLPPTSYIRSKDLNDLSEKLLLKSFSSGCQINGLQLSAGEFYANAQSCNNGFGGVAIPSRGHFSQIFPTINISNLSQPSSTISSSLDMNLQALDLLTSARFSGTISQPSHNNLGLFKESLSFGLDHLQQSTNRPSNSSSKISPFTNGVAEVKRPSSFLEPKATQATPKKSRLESRASCPPIKVRKEKLGDRIAALQQLVAPFGKTDTASVLMEAIGYIKFLQNQVETLSVPYMKSSRNKSSISMQGGSADGEGSEEPRRDLRSRGLCLVPLSCMSYVTTDCGGGGVWPPPSFGGGT